MEKQRKNTKNNWQRFIRLCSTVQNEKITDVVQYIEQHQHDIPFFADSSTDVECCFSAATFQLQQVATPSAATPRPSVPVLVNAT